MGGRAERKQDTRTTNTTTRHQTQTRCSAAQLQRPCFSRNRSCRAWRWASMPAHPGSMAPPKAHAARSSLSLTVPTEYWARGGGLARPPPVICEPPRTRDVHHTPTLFLVRLSRAPSFPVTRPSAHPPHLISGPPVRRGAPTCGRARGLLVTLFSHIALSAQVRLDRPVVGAVVVHGLFASWPFNRRRDLASIYDTV